LALIGNSTSAIALQDQHNKTDCVILGLKPKPCDNFTGCRFRFSHSRMYCRKFVLQRCTFKRLYVHESIAEEFNKRFAAKVDALIFWKPWDKAVILTPLPEKEKPAYIQELIDDAIDKGAKVINAKGEAYT
jgi:glyceraldehyde-3-phosphate dehydrogenase (NADP+)